MENAPVMIVGASRSGTTLVYHLLLASGAFPLYFGESALLLCSRHYGILRAQRSRVAFLSDFLKSYQFRASNVDSRLVEQKVMGEWRGWVDFFSWFMGEMATIQGKSRWAEKTPRHMEFLEEIERELPAARVVHVIRDGRDVALSRRKLGWAVGPFADPGIRLIWAAQRWRREVERGVRWGRRTPGMYVEVRYEAIVEDTDSALGLLGSSLGVEVSAEKYVELQNDPRFRRNSAFGRLKGISETPVFRWRNMATESERAMLHTAIGPTLESLGYEVPQWPRLQTRDRALVGMSNLAITASDTLTGFLPSHLRRRTSPLDLR